ncbi:phosphatidylserine decarboxylase proenzyme, mitochondrial-like isoform X3 [Ctenocephalides felis]|uniref:phosphatidylserine decarboxylase proenzyme, mitochondrial-like isoform X3 n=1 Tax=Ctenocephalides felis TaxID=7515 RepID=UPI000E6E3016|nr:phosphatidylserine decarboxylase proenzyme, mitochondrial-like isoform X3 [Ctenocephalides felis]
MVLYIIPKTRFVKNVGSFKSLKKYAWNEINQSCAQKHCLNNGNGTRIHHFSTTGSTNASGNQQGGGGTLTKGMTKSWKWRSVLSVFDWWILAAGGWVTWRGVLTRWTPLGICLIVAMQWRSRRKDGGADVKTASDFEIQCYTSLPLRMFSRCFGWLADCRVPTPLRPVVYGCYASAFGVNMQEALVTDFKQYRSLASFFSRPLKPDARTIDPNSCLISPCDGTVLHCGVADGAYIEQVKGVSYKLDCFLGPPTWCQADEKLDETNDMKVIDVNKFNGSSALYQCVIYLAPGDYHRFHSPTVWNPVFRRHVPGELLSVNPKIANWVPGLFCLNERVHYVGTWKHGFFSFTAVGATNVGSVKVYADETLSTNRWRGWRSTLPTLKNRPKINEPPPREHCNECNIKSEIRFGKGELIGHFNMGSTIVLVFEAPANFKFALKPGDRVKMGQRLGFLGQYVEQLTTKDSSNDKDEHCI